MYTVIQLSRIAGVSPRTLHYYDEIGLLKPTAQAQNGYRYYGEEALLRLQQVLLYRELDFSLEQIRKILDEPGFDAVAALKDHSKALRSRMKRIGRLIRTVDMTISHLEGEKKMSGKNLFDGFSEEKQKEYEKEARRRWGDKAVDDSMKLWNRSTAEEKEKIKAEGEAVYRDLAGHVGEDAGGPAVQAIVARWHQHLRHFYEPSTERMKGLADLYVDDPAFRTSIGRVHADLPRFLHDAVLVYVDRLEKAKAGEKP